jgi:hypothetical protein
LAQFGVVGEFSQEINEKGYIIQVVDEDEEQDRPQDATLWDP